MNADSSRVSALDQRHSRAEMLAQVHRRDRHMGALFDDLLDRIISIMEYLGSKFRIGGRGSNPFRRAIFACHRSKKMVLNSDFVVPVVCV